MSVGNGACGLPAAYTFRMKDSRTDGNSYLTSAVHSRYTLLIDRQTVILELMYNGSRSTYAVPQKLFEEKFLPKVIDTGYMAGNDKQIAQVKNFIWRWMLFTNTLTIQKPTSPDGRHIQVDNLK